MSNPLASLKKSRKNPLPGLGLQSGKNVPFRAPDYSEDESKLLDEITNKMAEEKLKDLRSSSMNPFKGGIPEQMNPGSTSHRSTPVKTVPSDNELIGLMSTRLTHLEQRLQHQAKEMAEKDKKIKILEEKINILQNARGTEPGVYSSDKSKQLERKCLLLQQQVHEMETFLADYGMVWVGEEIDLTSDVYHDGELETIPASPAFGNNGLWEPEKSTVGANDFELDYDLVIRNVDELNTLAGDGIGQIQKTSGGAKLKMQDPIPLILYANGILMFKGPFRPMSDAPTQECLRDLMDGYFPSELQGKYPDGVPISITDKRKIIFQDKRSDVFKGSGQVLGGDTKPSRLVPSNLNSNSNEKDGKQSPRFVKATVQENKGTLISEGEDGQAQLEVETELPGPKLTMDQFLNKLPQSVIKQGRVIDIRNSVGDTLQTSSSSPRKHNHISVIETKAVKDMKDRMKIAEEKRPPSAKDLTTLRIKSQKGDHTFILKMRFDETIGDIRKYLLQHRPQISDDYYIMSAFPRKIFDNDKATLKECGLVPNAALHLKNY